MAIQLLDAAFNLKLKATTKIVALALANRCNSKTGQCNPSIRRIANDTGLSVRSVHRQLATLRKEGLVIVHKSGQLLRNRYVLRFGSSGQIAKTAWQASGDSVSPTLMPSGHPKQKNDQTEEKPEVEANTSAANASLTGHAEVTSETGKADSYLVKLWKAECEKKGLSGALSKKDSAIISQLRSTLTFDKAVVIIPEAIQHWSDLSIRLSEDIGVSRQIPKRPSPSLIARCPGGVLDWYKDKTRKETPVLSYRSYRNKKPLKEFSD